MAFQNMQFQEQNFSIEELRAKYGSGEPSQWPKPHLDSVAKIGFQDIGLLPKVVYPEDNPYSKEKEMLGKLLFFDPRLSKSKQIACASCHDSEFGWGDGRRTSFGHDRQLGKRNAMTLFNLAFVGELFWDGRASTIEEQVHFPLEDPLEMQSTRAIAVENLKAIPEYQTHFEAAYGDGEINFERVRKAIATFERGIRSNITRFDRFIGGNRVRYTDEEVLGLHLFRTKARCINCHNSPYFSDNQYHNTGLHYYGRPFEDLGRYPLTKKKEDVGKFRTGTLREIARTGPYMHNGLFPNLKGVINMYNAGMPRPKRKAHQENDSLFPTTTDLVKELHLDKSEREALEAFLHTLTSSGWYVAPPELPGL